MHSKQIQFKWHDPEMSEIEGLISRGDALSGDLIYEAYRLGAQFDQWSEYFSYDTWVEAARRVMEKSGVDLFLRMREPIPAGVVLPWEITDPGIDRTFLEAEADHAFDQAVTEDCRTGKCTLCGVCMRFKVRNITAVSATPSEEGS